MHTSILLRVKEIQYLSSYPINDTTLNQEHLLTYYSSIISWTRASSVWNKQGEERTVYQSLEQRLLKLLWIWQEDLFCCGPPGGHQPCPAAWLGTVCPSHRTPGSLLPANLYNMCCRSGWTSLGAACPTHSTVGRLILLFPHNGATQGPVIHTTSDDLLNSTQGCLDASSSEKQMVLLTVPTSTVQKSRW